MEDKKPKIDLLKSLKEKPLTVIGQLFVASVSVLKWLLCVVICYSGVFSLLNVLMKVGIMSMVAFNDTSKAELLTKACETIRSTVYSAPIAISIVLILIIVVWYIAMMIAAADSACDTDDFVENLEDMLIKQEDKKDA